MVMHRFALLSTSCWHGLRTCLARGSSWRGLLGCLIALVVLLAPVGPALGAPLYALERVVEPTASGWRLRLEVRNVTDEVSGDGREQRLRGLTIREPVPPEALLTVASSRAERGQVEPVRSALPACPPMVLDAIYGFIPGDEALTPNMLATLERWASRLPESGRIRVVGFTDQVGNAAFNRRLSRQRAAVVGGRLNALGIAQERLLIEGLGEARPVTTDSGGQALNRRVELYPADAPTLVWTIDALAPGEQVELIVQFAPGPFYRSETARRWFADGPCHGGEVAWRDVVPTRAAFVGDVEVRQQTPFGERMPPSTLSACEPVTLSFDWQNQGARSGVDVAASLEIPAEAELIYSDATAVELVEGVRRLTWAQPRVARGARLRGQVEVAAPRRSSQALSWPVRTTITATSASAVAVEQTVALAWPQVALAVDGVPERLYPGAEQKIQVTVTGVGPVPVDTLRLLGHVPISAEIIQLGAEGERRPGNAASRQLAWTLGRLAPGEQARTEFSLRVMENTPVAAYPITLTAFDAGYGEATDNPCMVVSRRTEGSVQALVPAEMVLATSEEVLTLGQTVRLRADVTNANPIAQAYRLGGHLAPALWQVNRVVLSGVDSAGGEQVLGTRVTGDGALRVSTTDRSEPVLEIPAGGRARVELVLEAVAVGPQALQALSGALVSRFSVAAPMLSLEHHLGLTRTEGSAEILIYQ